MTGTDAYQPPVPDASHAHPFDTDTQVHEVAPGEFTTTITDRWNALGGQPNGGYLLAVCAQALRRQLPFPDPLVVSAFFLRRGTPGPATVHTEVARTGRRLATGEARLHQENQEVVRAVASFADGDRSTGRTLVRNDKPDLPPPEDLVDLLGGGSLPGVSLTEQLEYRAAQAPGWAQGAPTGQPRAEFWMRLRGRDPDPFALLLLVDGAAPVVLELGESGSSTVELTVHVRANPAPGWLACRAETRHVIDGYHEEDFEIWDSTGRLVAQARQLALL